MDVLVVFELIFSVVGDDGSKSRTAAAMTHTSGVASEEMRDAASIMSLGVRAVIPLWSCGVLVEPTTRVTLWPILSKWSETMNPVRPEEVLVITLTGSMFDDVAP